MTDDRTRGAALYTIAAALLAGGTFWWFAAAPADQGRSRKLAWNATAERLLPTEDNQEAARTVPLEAGAEREELVPLGVGEYLVTMMCVGEPHSVLRVDVAGGSGQLVRCADDDNEEATLARQVVTGELRIRASTDGSGPMVMRFVVTRYNG